MAPSRLLLLLLPRVNAAAVRVWTRPLAYAARPRFPFIPEGKRRTIVMANVTKGNFGEASEQLQTHLQAADFVALDFEMTGVETATWRRHSELDTYETRYQHIKNSAESFAVWQCGVCPFKWDEAGKKFVAFPYNFYIFPRNELPVDMTSRSYFCQTSSLEFLAKHHFDFNATVYNGISYLSLEQEEIARAKLGLTEEAKNLKRVVVESESEIPLTKTADVVFSERVRVQLGQWRDGLLRNKQQWQGTARGVEGSKGDNVSSQSAQRISVDPQATEVSGKPVDAKAETFGSLNSATGEVVGDELSSSPRPSYFVDIFGNNQARLVKQVLRKHYQDLVPIVIAKPNNEERQQVRIIFTSSKDDKAKLEEELEVEGRKGLEGVLSNAVGFRTIIDAIKAAGKPLVGHNCLLDLAHLHDKFVGPLPPSVTGFSASIRHHFPCVLDTKYLLKTEPTLRDANGNRSTSLAIAYQEFCHGFSDKAGIPGRFYNGKPKIVGRPMSRVKLEISSELQRYSGGTDTGLKHEAGFDAYMTGAVFAQLCHILQVDIGTMRSLPHAAGNESMGFASYANLLMLQTFRGQVALDLSTGHEAVGIKAPRGPSLPPYRLPQRDNVALFWGLLPVRGQDVYLRKLVQKVFAKDKRLANVDIYPVDGSSAFVEFRSPTILEGFIKAIQVSGTGVTLSLSGGPDDEFLVKVARFEDYERICRSPLATQSLGMAADLLGVNLVGATTFPQSDINKSLTAAHLCVDQSLPTSTNKDQIANDSSLGAFEVGSWGEQTSTLLLEQEVVGQLDSAGISGDTQDRIKLERFLNPERTTHSGSIFQVSTDGEAVNEVDTYSKGKESSALDSSYSKWMKRAFDEGGQATSPVIHVSSPKKPRAVQGLEDGEINP